MNYTNLFMTRGDTFGFDILIEGLSSDLDEAYFSVRTDINDPAVYTFQKSLSDGITKVDISEASNRQYHIEVAPEDTDNVELGDYYYDLQLTAGTDVFTPLKGIIKIDYDVTRPSGSV